MAEWKRDDARNDREMEASCCRLADPAGVGQRTGQEWTGGKKFAMGGVEKAEPKPKAFPVIDEDEAEDSSGWEDEDENRNLLCTK